ncbi:MAG: hypothetical protein D6679_12465 [Candidatus Hydrogenedentota bacterium]|nr:MAG: hypothetical protein D6679_12465 [Candidatus Hydrogenedentota bacterium]
MKRFLLISTFLLGILILLLGIHAIWTDTRRLERANPAVRTPAELVPPSADFYVEISSLKDWKFLAETFEAALDSSLPFPSPAFLSPHFTAAALVSPRKYGIAPDRPVGFISTWGPERGDLHVSCLPLKDPLRFLQTLGFPPDALSVARRTCLPYASDSFTIAGDYLLVARNDRILRDLLALETKGVSFSEQTPAVVRFIILPPFLRTGRALLRSLENEFDQPYPRLGLRVLETLFGEFERVELVLEQSYDSSLHARVTFALKSSSPLSDLFLPRDTFPLLRLVPPAPLVGTLSFSPENLSRARETLLETTFAGSGIETALVTLGRIQSSILSGHVALALSPSPANLSAPRRTVSLSVLRTTDEPERLLEKIAEIDSLQKKSWTLLGFRNFFFTPRISSSPLPSTKYRGIPVTGRRITIEMKEMLDQLGDSPLLNRFVPPVPTTTYRYTSIVPGKRLGLPSEKNPFRNRAFLVNGTGKDASSLMDEIDLLLDGRFSAADDTSYRRLLSSLTEPVAGILLFDPPRLRKPNSPTSAPGLAFLTEKNRVLCVEFLLPFPSLRVALPALSQKHLPYRKPSLPEP